MEPMLLARLSRFALPAGVAQVRLCRVAGRTIADVDERIGIPAAEPSSSANKMLSVSESDMMSALVGLLAAAEGDGCAVVPPAAAPDAELCSGGFERAVLAVCRLGECRRGIVLIRGRFGTAAGAFVGCRDRGEELPSSANASDSLSLSMYVRGDV